jgi:alpha/beta superfamily hydrolase
MLIVQGERDRYGSPAGVAALAERFRAHAPVDVRVVPGADHFFTGHLTALAGALRSGLGLAAEDR